MVDLAALRLALTALADWWSDQRRETVAYLIEENRILRAQLSGRRLRLTMRTGVGWPGVGTVWGVGD